jgi:hypothetical protein
MNRVIITDMWGERLLIDTDSVIAITQNRSLILFDGGPECGCYVYIAGGAILEVSLTLSDLVAALVGCDLVDGDDFFQEDESDLN